MAWTGLIMKLGDVTSIDDLPKDFQPPPLGKSESIAADLRRMFPEAEHDQGASSLQGTDFYLELAYGCHTDADGIVSSISVRSNAGSGALDPIRRICRELGARLYDCQTGELADLGEGTSQSMKTYTEWRDRVIDASERQD